ncbi:hypothetical protein CS542_10385 [Pedobacter sp. IW39]|nr:hypothetical protein CS542_10385 [Pedobacter sp. IW39]
MCFFCAAVYLAPLNWCVFAVSVSDANTYKIFRKPYRALRYRFSFVKAAVNQDDLDTVHVLNWKMNRSIYYLSERREGYSFMVIRNDTIIYQNLPRHSDTTLTTLFSVANHGINHGREALAEGKLKAWMTT